MKRLKIGILLVILMLTGCSQPAPAKPASAYQKITAEDAKARIDSGDPVTVIDVRTASEYAVGHIEGSLLIPVETIGDTPPVELPDKDAEILIYCRSGNRSLTASEALLKLGYTKIFDFGGIKDWPYETITGDYETAGAATDALFGSFTTPDLAGNEQTEAVLKDHKLTMINVWATFCGPCINEMPDLGEINKEYKDNGFQIIGIVSDAVDMDGNPSSETIALANDIISQTGADYLHVLPSAALFEGPLRTLTVVPTTYFADENGVQVGETYTGGRTKEKWTEIIDSLLSQVN